MGRGPSAEVVGGRRAYEHTFVICGAVSRVSSPPPNGMVPPWYAPEILVKVVTVVSKVPTVTGMGPSNPRP